VIEKTELQVSTKSQGWIYGDFLSCVPLYVTAKEHGTSISLFGFKFLVFETVFGFWFVLLETIFGFSFVV